MILNVVETVRELILAQLPVDSKTNEITGIPELLELLDISGSTVTIDAIGTQTAIMDQMDYFVDAVPTRGMSDATIESSNGSFDESVIESNLCQECLDKVTASLEGYFEEGKEEYLLFCLVDFETLDIYSKNERGLLGYRLLGRIRL